MKPPTRLLCNHIGGFILRLVFCVFLCLLHCYCFLFSQYSYESPSFCFAFSSAISAFFWVIISASLASHCSRVSAYTFLEMRLPFTLTLAYFALVGLNFLPRRGFSAEKRVLGPPLRRSSPCAERIELEVQCLTASRLLLSN